jgi:hypothetical protein
MNLSKVTALSAVVILLTACGEGGSNSGNTSDSRRITTGTLPAMESDSDPTPQSGTGGTIPGAQGGESRP